VPERDLGELTWLFEEARYSVHELSGDYGHRAALALRSIREAMTPGWDLGRLEPQLEGSGGGRAVGGGLAPAR
jgi:hypothetical protein